MDEDKQYYVCANYKDRVIDTVDARRRSNVSLNPQARTPIVITDKTTLRVVFDFDDGQEEYKEVMYDDELEDNKERFSRVGHHTNFPKQVLSYKFRKPFGDINYRQKQICSNNIVKELLANYVNRK